MREEREQAKSERAEMEAKIEQQRLAMESQRVQMEAKLEQFAQQAQAATDAKLDQAEEQKKAMVTRLEHMTTEQQLPALQARIEALHAAKLLSDDELFSIEDLIADLEVGSEDTRVGQLITLSSRMAGDAAFSRQIRRKIL